MSHEMQQQQQQPPAHKLFHDYAEAINLLNRTMPHLEFLIALQPNLKVRALHSRLYADISSFLESFYQ